MPDIITAATAEDYKQARELLREYQLDVKVEMCFQGSKMNSESWSMSTGHLAERCYLCVRGDGRRAVLR